MYQYKEASAGVRRYILSLDNHVSLMEGLSAFCRDKHILCGKVSGLGAIGSATFRFLDPATKKYVDKTFEEQMEITCLTGNISNKDGQLYLHVHITASRRDYTCIGGHLLDARISGACELFVEEYLDTEIGRRPDEETGLNLYKF
ncbi:MAG: DNA-binding protein [Bacteroidales bacterium]|nr:DNA-binding protein [Bacteroidales bacterium]